MARMAHLRERMVPLLAHLAWAALWMAAGGEPAVAASHEGPPVYVELTVEDDAVRLLLQGEKATLHPWLGLSRELDGAVDGDAIVRATRSAFETKYELSLDGQRVAPSSLAWFEPSEQAFAGEAATGVEISFPTSGQRPMKVGLLWPETFGPEWGDDTMTVQVVCMGRVDWYEVSQTEPECTWHARTFQRRGVETPVASLEPLPPVEARWPPWWVCVFFLVVSALIAVSPGIRWVRVVALVTALGNAALLVWLLSSPAGAPTEPEAAELFERVHRNIYAAFDEPSESAIYDRLAYSFEPRLLDEQYQDIFHSLVLRQHGGAVCRIESLTVLDGSIDHERPPPDLEDLDENPAFWVTWSWRVLGTVVHYGHRHQRMNQTKADYYVRLRDGRWRIAFVDEDEGSHERVDDDEEEWGSWSDEVRES